MKRSAKQPPPCHIFLICYSVICGIRSSAASKTLSTVNNKCRGAKNEQTKDPVYNCLLKIVFIEADGKRPSSCFIRRTAHWRRRLFVALFALVGGVLFSPNSGRVQPSSHPVSLRCMTLPSYSVCPYWL